ncbi:MAG: phenylalanine 4-monooxygenase [Alphaproteobacteria bacterium]|nr:phenylalanine 4-monooxygenase [Alphaproteobacteria bacterium]
MKEFRSHPDAHEDGTIDQNWQNYTPTDHDVWKTLYNRQMGLLPGRVCDEYLQGVEVLGINEHKIPKFEELSAILKPRTGWEIVAVPGLIPSKPFFTLLANRKFPVTNWIRKPEEMDYLEEPDLFHDLFGHVPLLTNPVFGDYIAAYGRGGLKAMDLKSLRFITRLFWYSVEFGLINTSQGLRIYGAGIVSSRGETLYALESDSPHRIGFDIMRMMQTKYRIDDYQESYFVIENFDQLFDATRPDFTPYYERLREMTTLDPSFTYPEDTLFHLGTGEYARERKKEST